MIIRFVFSNNVFACSMVNWRETRLKKKRNQTGGCYSHPGEKRVAGTGILTKWWGKVRIKIFRANAEMWWLTGHWPKESNGLVV